MDLTSSPYQSEGYYRILSERFLFDDLDDLSNGIVNSTRTIRDYDQVRDVRRVFVAEDLMILSLHLWWKEFIDGCWRTKNVDKKL